MHHTAPVCARSEDQIVEYGGVGRDPDAAAHHDGHLELVPVLVPTAERAFDADLGRVVLVLLAVVDLLVEVVAELPRPRTVGLKY